MENQTILLCEWYFEAEEAIIIKKLLRDNKLREWSPQSNNLLNSEEVGFAIKYTDRWRYSEESFCSWWALSRACRERNQAGEAMKAACPLDRLLCRALWISHDSSLTALAL